MTDLSKIQDIEDVIKSMDGAIDGKDFPVEHYQIEGVYARSLFIPAGMVLVGAIHNKEHISILSQGTLRVFDGDVFKEITAPYTCVDKAGVKRLGYALTDCTFINVLRTDKTDIADIEHEAVSQTFEEFEQRKLEAL